MFRLYPHNIGLLLLSASLLFINSAFAENKTDDLVGEINEVTGEYISGDKGFSVTLPIKGSRTYILNSMTDTFTARGTILSIKPTKNGSTYRLETSNALDENERKASFSQASATTFDWYRRLATRSYKRPLLKISTHTFELNGKQSITSIYKQFATDKQGPRFHLFYLTDFGEKLAFVWTDIPLQAENIEIEDQIINGTAKESKKSIAMLKSLTFK